MKGDGLIRETIEVGVIVERRVLHNPWVDHIWVPTAVLVGAPATADWTPLHETAELTRYYAGRTELALFASDTTMYRENLLSSRPSLWVSLRPAETAPGVVLMLVTADPADAEALTQTGTDTIEAVPMPHEVQQRLATFIKAHHVERPFIKRKRDRADPEAMATQPRKDKQ